MRVGNRSGQAQADTRKTTNHQRNFPGSRTPNKRPPDSPEKGSPNRGAAGAYLRVSSRFSLDKAFGWTRARGGSPPADCLQDRSSSADSGRCHLLKLSTDRDENHSGQAIEGLTRPCGIDHIKHFTRYESGAAPNPLGIQEKSGGFCDPAAGLLFLQSSAAQQWGVGISAPLFLAATQSILETLFPSSSQSLNR